MSENTPETLPGLDAIRRNPGRNETAAHKTISNLLNRGILTDADSALIELVLSTARDVDSISDWDAASGRASLRKTYLSVLATLDEVSRSRGGIDEAPADRVLSLVSHG